jgi:hypothetical protein
MRSWALLLLSTTLAAQPVRLHPANPRYLEYRGKPLLIVASGEHYGAVLNLDFDYIKYLDAMQRDGMNYTRTFSGSYVEPAGAFGIKRNTLGPANGRFLAPWVRTEGRYNLDEWNPEYFVRMKDFVRRAGERGVMWN